MDAKEFAERRYINKTLNATINYAKSKLGGFPIDVQFERHDDIWRVTITVQWVSQPLPLKIMPSTDVDGLL